ncbi:hypothetical protein CRE_26713 [Caenorhabditis remanei]|uniref:ETS domain-containing protein n=1 Tax=Caenorhabditis remanei TaxID=31234 RepID=E3MXT9_CAERE|nr:hypothetical protein CRE_26713 [Caenorhabditis remanei]
MSISYEQYVIELKQFCTRYDGWKDSHDEFKGIIAFCQGSMHLNKYKDEETTVKNDGIVSNQVVVKDSKIEKTGDAGEEVGIKTNQLFNHVVQDISVLAGSDKRNSEKTFNVDDGMPEPIRMTLKYDKANKETTVKNDEIKSNQVVVKESKIEKTGDDAEEIGIETNQFFNHVVQDISVLAGSDQRNSEKTFNVDDGMPEPIRMTLKYDKANKVAPGNKKNLLPIKPKTAQDPKLRNFLLRLVLKSESDSNVAQIIKWSLKSNLEFQLLDCQEVAKQWGIHKGGRKKIDYQSLSRSLRSYYAMNLVKKETTVKNDGIKSNQVVVKDSKIEKTGDVAEEVGFKMNQLVNHVVQDISVLAGSDQRNSEKTFNVDDGMPEPIRMTLSYDKANKFPQLSIKLLTEDGSRNTLEAFNKYLNSIKLVRTDKNGLYRTDSIQMKRILEATKNSMLKRRLLHIDNTVFLFCSITKFLYPKFQFCFQNSLPAK